MHLLNTSSLARSRQVPLRAQKMGPAGQKRSQSTAAGPKDGSSGPETTGKCRGGPKSPSIDTRAKIWMSHIDGLSEDNAKYLAKSYDFSGGHIKNIASKCLIYFALHHRALPPLSDIITYCDAEKIAEKTSKIKDVKICGF